MPTTLEKIQKKIKEEEALLKKQSECIHSNWAVVCACCGKILGSEKTQEFGKIIAEHFL